LESYQAGNVGDALDKIYFTGVVGWVKDIIDEVGGVTKIESKVLPYSELMDIPPETKEAEKVNGVSLLSAIAPPMVEDKQHLKLVPEDVKAGQEIKKKSRSVAQLGIFAMITIGLVVSAMVLDVYFKNAYLDKLAISFEKEAKAAQQLTDVSDRVGIARRFIEKKDDILFVLSELFNLMPNEVYLSSIDSRADGTLIFTGTADSMSRVFSLVTQLENSNVFKGVKVDFTKTRRQNDREVADFGFTMFVE